MSKLRIDIWSDLACPWCYIGKRHLEQALATFPHADDVEIHWRAFELDPSAPAEASDEPNVDRLARKYGMPREQAQAMIDGVIARGAAVGLDMKLHSTRAGNTFDAHRLLHWAGTLGVAQQGALKERMMRGYQSECVALTDRDVLVSLAADAGLPPDDARAVLASDRYAREVRADEQLAGQLGITGVPFFVFAKKIGVSGAQPIDVMQQVLAKAWAEQGDRGERGDGGDANA